MDRTHMQKKNYSEDIEILRIIGNKLNARVITLLRRHPMNPYDLSKYLDKKESDVVRRLKSMERMGIVKSKWGVRLGQNVKIYSLAIHNALTLKFNHEGIKLEPATDSDDDGKAIKHDHRLVEIPESEFFFPVHDMDQVIVGREEELKVLHGSMPNFIFITGIAGIGKTSLAMKFIREVRQNNDNNLSGVLWHTFNEIDTLNYLLNKVALFLAKNGIRELLEYLDYGNNTNDNIKSLHGSKSLDLATRLLNKLEHCILIFDDFHKVRDEQISIYMKYLYKYSKNKVLLISRSSAPFFLDLPHSRQLVLSGLPLTDSMTMLEHIGFNIDSESDKNKLWNKLNGHPMALKIFCLIKQERKANQLSSAIMSMDDLLSYFKKEIFEVLNEDEMNILMALSAYRTPVKANALRYTTRSTASRRSMNYLIYSLEKKMLLGKTSNQQFYLHDMIKDLLYSMLIYPEDVHFAAAQYYLSECTTESIMESLHHLIKCRNLMKIISILEEEAINEKYKFIEKGYAASLLEILQDVALLWKGNIDKRRLVLIYALEAKALSMLGRWDDAKEKVNIATRLANDISDNIILACSLKILGESLYLNGDFDALEKNLIQAATLLQGFDNKEKLLQNIYMKLARMYFATGRPQQSKQYAHMAKSLAIPKP